MATQVKIRHFGIGERESAVEIWGDSSRREPKADRRASLMGSFADS
ncbi:MAG: hypothetical protein GW865_01040 [Candidatus Aenigmarchaeota archaeon]|nr:hypothetical protein [Candidatus Aenigmarchaeota archaeon]